MLGFLDTFSKYLIAFLRFPSLYFFTLHSEKCLGTDFLDYFRFQQEHLLTKILYEILFGWFGCFVFHYVLVLAPESLFCIAFLFPWVLLFLNSGFPFSPSKSSISLNILSDLSVFDF